MHLKLTHVLLLWLALNIFDWLFFSDPGQTTVSLGDTFSVSIRLYDGYGSPISRGGADVRPRMFDVKRKAYATAAVRDHGNGTYTATFRAVWAGNTTIKVKIAHTPEDVRAIYYIRRKVILSYKCNNPPYLGTHCFL